MQISKYLIGFMFSLMAAQVAYAVDYEEDFEDGLAQDWEAQTSGQWQIKGRSTTNRFYQASDAENDTVMVSTYAGAEYKDLDFRVSARNNDVYAAYVLVRATPDFYHLAGIEKGSGYAFGFSAECNGVLPSGYNVIKLTNGVYENIQPWTPSDALRCDTKGNRIRVVAKGSVLKFYVNNKLVYKFTDAAPLPAGRIGLVGYTGQPFPTVHRFDNVYVTDLSALTPAATDNDEVSAHQQALNEKLLNIGQTETLK
ncbi:hypothetical protein [Methylocucumis oryzae]|nr:hypothetical protein [Methylocucumis oryzae]